MIAPWAFCNGATPVLQANSLNTSSQERACESVLENHAGVLHLEAFGVANPLIQVVLKSAVDWDYVIQMVLVLCQAPVQYGLIDYIKSSSQVSSATESSFRDVRHPFLK